MTTTLCQISTDKNVLPASLAALLGAVGWGDESAYDGESLQRSIAGSAFVAYATDAQGKMVGYLSALSDGVFTAFVDMVIVDPAVQRNGIGKALVAAAEQHFAGIPIYVMPFQDQQEFFQKQGYKAPKRAMLAMSKRNGMG